jgi:light-regulated signal transduction histidine kinase (bacteriophytochrome)
MIFERLHTQTIYKGYGIGLAHCKKIIEIHNGEIWVDSILGEGSTFNFTISKKI